jgi:glycosyltransferase involved in cell wall biosynthesis
LLNINLFIPCLNRKELLLETLSSLPIFEHSLFEINLVVTVLGNSTDGTQEAIKETYGERVIYIGENDLGLYDALGKNLQKVFEGYVTWLGAGDKWGIGALKAIHKMIDNEKKWFMGRPLIFDSKGDISKIYPVSKYKSRLILEGWYQGYLPFIQQESTIWHVSLHRNVDWEKFRKLKLAGDYYLWTCFAKNENLFSSTEHIGGYRIHENSLSGTFFEEYKNEINSFTKKTQVGKFLAHMERIKLIIPKIKELVSEHISYVFVA